MQGLFCKYVSPRLDLILNELIKVKCQLVIGFPVDASPAKLPPSGDTFNFCGFLLICATDKVSGVSIADYAFSGEQQRRLPDFHHGLCFQCRSLERLLEDHLHSLQRIVCFMSSSIREQKYKCLKYPLSDRQFHNPRILLAWDQFPLLSIAVEFQVQGRHLGEFLWKPDP